jgi:hypothetical protein
MGDLSGVPRELGISFRLKSETGKAKPAALRGDLLEAQAASVKK